MKLLLKNGRILDPVSKTDTVADLLIIDGVIEKFRPGLSAGRSVEVRDLRQKIVAPGFIDMHVHLREPGFEHKETIASGCVAAAHGGFTAVCCMPNTDPAIDEASVVRTIIEKGKRAMNGVVDVFPIAAATKGRQGKELSPMMELADAGAVGFSDDGAPVADAEVMRRVLEYASMIGKPVIQHAEETSMTRGGAMNEGRVSTSLGLPPMPPVAEEVIIARDLRLAGYSGAAYHVAHISTQGALELVRSAKQQRLPVSCEVTPHHFSLTEDAVRSYDTNTKMNPPLRTQADVDALLDGLRDGTIDAIASDHAPHSFDEKQVEFSFAPFGVVGLETAVGLALTNLVGKGVISLTRCIELMSTSPRAILRLPAINIAEGEEANLTILDPELEWIVDAEQLRSKSKNTPFDKWKLKGKAVGIINNDCLNFY